MNRRYLFFCFFVISLFDNSLYPQTQDLEFERISLQQGLSQTSVFSIVQDHQGFLWFGTQDGLNKYDGYSFTVYRRDIADTTTISDNYITVLYVDRSGRLWAGTKGGGLNLYVSRTQQFIHYRHIPNDTNSISSDEIVCLCEDRRGMLWIGTPNGLNELDPASGRCTHYFESSKDIHSISNNYVQTLREDATGRLWIGMIDGSACFNPERTVITRVPSDVPVSLFDSFVEDSEGRLWAATPQSILYYAGGRWRDASNLLPTKEKLSGHVLLHDEAGVFWIGSNSGLYRIRNQPRDITRFVHDDSNPNSLSGDAVLSLFEDRTGILWVGTFEGINKYAPRRNRFRHFLWKGAEPHSLGWNKIRAFSEAADGTIWIGTQEGLATYRPGTNVLERYSSRYPYPKSGGTDLIWSLSAEDNGKSSIIWIGTNGNGLIKLENGLSDGRRRKYTRYIHSDADNKSLSGNVIFTMLETRSGDLWLGTLLEGLDRFDERTGAFARYKNDQSDPRSISSNEIWSLCEDRTGTLWIGTAGGGMDRFNTVSNDFDRFLNNPADTNSLSDNKVLAITEDSNGKIWIGTYAGLNCFEPKLKTFTHFTMKEGLPNDVVYGIQEDDRGYLWLSTNKGLSKFDPRTGKFRNYDAGDGLQSDEFNHGAAYKDRKGEMFFGGINGFNVFNPDSVLDNPTIPQLVFTDFKIFDKSISPSPAEHRISRFISEADEIHLSYKDAVFSLGFAALEYTNPSKNNYAYIMEGFDKEWRYTGARHEATYTNLDPGEYIFRVKASNNDGVWNETGASIKIFVAPPYWQTWWFRALLIACLISAVAFVYSRRIRSLKREQVLQQDFSRRLIESQEAERKRIAGELHDSIGQDLLIIKNKLLLGLEAHRNSEEPHSEFRQAIDFVTRSLKSVREISRNLRPVQLDQLGLTAALESVIETISESSHLHAETTIENVDDLLDKDAEINFFRIVQECLNNILKHSHATHLSVEVALVDDVLRLTVRDDGRGMEPSDREKRGFGLSSMSERARILGGDLRVESSAGNGTKVLLFLPIRKVQHG
ncbi:MAG TPA: two-component regulator propeller domain-containing protein [Bacteroidota bacterium]|nr:two-component regulator propeller domain-containing protein [Bacteroidota bacterium]